MKTTKVLFVLLQLDAGGSERVVFDLARGLNPEEFEIFVAAFRGGVLADPLKSICKEVIILEKKHKLDIGAMLKLAYIVKKYRIDVVNAHHYMPCFYCFYGTRVFNGNKLIYTEHSVPEVEKIADCFHGRIFSSMLYRINAVVGVSSAIVNKFKEKYPRHANKFHKILNAVDIEKFRVKGTRKDIRSRWGLAKEHFVVGTVANFRKVKNHACLVRAAARLKLSHPQLRLFFVGTGFADDAENSENEVRCLIRDLGIQDRVVLAGYQENIPEMLYTFDAFCLPSFSEGLPVSLLEAMASGVPVIGSDVAGNSEVVTHRKTGLLFPSGDYEGLSRLIVELMAEPDLSKALSSNGFQYVDNNHSNKNWITLYQKLFTR